MAADEKAPVEGAPKDKKKLFIIIGAAAVVIIALAVVFLGGGKKEKGKEGEAEAKVEQKAEGGHGGGKEGAAGAVTTAFALEPFIVNIYDGQELRYLRVKVEFETATPDAKAEIESRQPPCATPFWFCLPPRPSRTSRICRGKTSCGMKSSWRPTRFCLRAR